MWWWWCREQDSKSLRGLCLKAISCCFATHRNTASKAAAVKITIRPVTRRKSNSVWVTYLVQEWKENDRWQRRQFKNEDEAKTYAAFKQVELENKGRAQRMILSSLTQEQHDATVSALDRHGDHYLLADAVEFFLKHHRPPEFTVRLRTLKALKASCMNSHLDAITRHVTIPLT